MKLPEYMTTEEVQLKENKILPVGSFVQPIDFYHLPKHIKDDFDNRFFNADHEVYVFCHFGIVKLDRKIIRKIG